MLVVGASLSVDAILHGASYNVVQGIRYKAQGAGHKAQGTEHRVPCALSLNYFVNGFFYLIFRDLFAVHAFHFSPVLVKQKGRQAHHAKLGA